MYKKYLKRLFDFILSLIGLVISGPFLIIFGLLLAIVNNGNPFFFQKRPGLSEKIFSIVKFKTMNDAKDRHGKLLPDEDRLTTVGKFVRRSSIDELPQLINVLKGDMSFIGPRPLLPGYLPLYSSTQKKRHDVKPGITGWAQINGRNAISWTEKFSLDIWYVENISFVLDIRILILTTKKVLLRSDINKEGEATTEAFNGNN